MTDRLVGVLLAVFAVWYGLAAGQFSMGFTDPLGPTAFPRMVAVPLGVLSLYLVLRPDPDPEWVRGWPLAKQAATVAVLVAYALVLEAVGFLIATPPAIAMLARLLNASWWQGITAGIVVGGALFVLFDIVLGLPLPAGPAF